MVTVSRWCDTEPSHGQVMSNVLVTHPGHHPGAEMELRHDANMSVKSVTSYTVTRAPWMAGVTWSHLESPITAPSPQ